MADGVGGAGTSVRLVTGELAGLGCIAVVITPDDLGGEIGG